MFDAVRNNKKIVQIFLLLITLPFAFWGVDSYVRNMGSSNSLATVGGTTITPAEFQNALREQQEKMRAALGANYNPAMLESAEVKRAVLENLVNQRLLAIDAAKQRLNVSDAQIRNTIGAIPAFQENGQFSLPRYEALLKAQGLNQSSFEARLRHDLALQQVLSAVADGAMALTGSTQQLYAVQFEERTVSEAVLTIPQYSGSVKLASDAARKFYDENRKRFEVAPQVRAEYIVLSKDTVAEQLSVSDADVRKEYDAHQERYRQGGERRLSHILIEADKSATPEVQKAAKEKAEALLKTLKANPADFEKLAKENSKDPGSAENGGDLGFVSKGMMVKPFEDAAYALTKEGELSNVVQTEYGFHIIKMTSAKPEKIRAFDEVKAEIATELKRTEAAKKFAEMVEGFTNTVYEQSDSLQPAAEKYKLPIKTSDWIVRNGKTAAPFNNEKLLTELFGDDAVKNKRNTNAIDVGNGSMVAARVAEFKPAALRPFEEVKADIEKTLVAEEALKLAEKDGEAKLAQLKKGDAVEVQWSPAKTISRAQQGVAPELMRTIFRAPSDKLPSYAGLSVPGGGYALFKIEKVTRPSAAADDQRLKAIQQQFSRVLAEQDFAAYLAALRKRYDVKINAAALEEPKDK